MESVESLREAGFRLVECLYKSAITHEEGLLTPGEGRGCGVFVSQVGCMYVVRDVMMAV